MRSQITSHFVYVGGERQFQALGVASYRQECTSFDYREHSYFCDVGGDMAAAAKRVHSKRSIGSSARRKKSLTTRRSGSREIRERAAAMEEWALDDVGNLKKAFLQMVKLQDEVPRFVLLVEDYLESQKGKLRQKTRPARKSGEKA
jgi:hypothetical protein